jgi:hypothetical protein
MIASELAHSLVRPLACRALTQDMYSFANIAFSRTVGQHKYLCCPDCEFGPLGYHELQPAGEGAEATGAGVSAPAVADDPESLAAATTPFLLAAGRVVGASADRPPKPTRTMDSAAAAAAGIDLSAFAPEPEPEPQPQPQPQLLEREQLPPLVDEDPSAGETIALTFSAAWLGLYLEDRPAPDSARAAGWPGPVESAIGRFNPVPAPPRPSEPGDGGGITEGPEEKQEQEEEEELVPGEAEASGRLEVGDVVLSIHGVDVRGIGTEDTVQLVMAAPRPFEMRFLRRLRQ